MTALSIAVWHNLPSGGGLRALVSHVTYLVNAGCRVEVFTPPTADTSFFPLPLDVVQHEVPLDPTRGRRFRDPLGPYRERLSSLSAMAQHAHRVADLVRKGSFDVLFDNSCQAFRAAPLAAHLDLPSVLYLGEPYRWFYEAMPELPWLADFDGGGLTGVRRRLTQVRAVSDLLGMRRQARTERAWAAAHDVILVNSQYSRESVLRAYALDSRVCYPGVDTKATAGVGPRADYALSVGAFVPEKNPAFVVDAVARTTALERRLVWVANVASPTLVEQVTAHAAEVGVVLEVCVAAPDALLEEHLRRAGVLIYAPRLEPFGLVPLEAMAVGLPVVAVAEGGVRETVVDEVSGLLCPADAGDVAKAADRLMTDDALRLGMVESAGRWARERFSDEAAGTRLLRELERVVALPVATA